MKKLLLLLLIAPVLGFGQVLTDVFYVWQNLDNRFTKLEHYWVDTKNAVRDYYLTVPDGKLWKIMEVQSFKIDDNDNMYLSGSGYNSGHRHANIYIYDETVRGSIPQMSYVLHEGSNVIISPPLFIEIGKTLIPSGTEFFFHDEYDYNDVEKLLIYEYSFDGNSFSYNEPETIQNNSNTPVLFPNPTSSLLALNSDKEYDIEVFDMAGNKVMALSGNNINMAHLSTATYIVKATDKSNNEELTYKVVKN
jgi:hypothetical protein